MSDSEITLTSEIGVEVVGQWGSDLGIAMSAWVSSSTQDHRAESEKRLKGLIGSLVVNRHGTPFETGMLRVLVHCPLFVAREWMRHRIGWSYNEQSGRYSELEPVFWVPREGRGLINDGTSMRPKLVGGDRERFTYHLQQRYQDAWDTYQYLLACGYAKEVARVVLPLGTYTRFVAQCNPRSLMHFLSLRTQDDAAAVRSYPMAEIEEAARQLEVVFLKHWPVTYNAWHNNGRIAP